MSPNPIKVAFRHLLQGAKALNLSHYDLEGLPEGKPTTLYHGTTASFKTFDMNRGRDELVNKFYGRGIFLTPYKHVAEKYAEANRNIGFDPSIIDDLKGKNRNAGGMLEALYRTGDDAWEGYVRDMGFRDDNPPPGKGSLDMVGFQKFLGGVDLNSLNDVAGYIIGSKVKPLGGEESPLDMFGGAPTGAPGYIYDTLDEIGLDSSVYRPKVYTVVATVSNTLITSSKAQAKKARSQGYDSVIYYGSDLVGGVPEVAVFDPHKVKVTHVEVVD